VWVGDRLLYGNGDTTALWSVTLDDAGPSSSRPLHAAPELGPVHTVGASSRVLGHDAAVLRVVPEPDARAHLQLLRFGAGEQLEALRVDDDPRSQSFVHQLVRE
jgi:hypothetical protein